MDVVDRHLVDGRGSAPPLSGLTDPRHSRIAADQSALPTGVSGGAPLEAFASVRNTERLAMRRSLNLQVAIWSMMVGGAHLL